MGSYALTGLMLVALGILTALLGGVCQYVGVSERIAYLAWDVPAVLYFAGAGLASFGFFVGFLGGDE